MLNDLADLKAGVSSISSRMLALLEDSVDVFMLYLDGQPIAVISFCAMRRRAARASCIRPTDVCRNRRRRGCAPT